jgi:hypothetical protein
MIYLEIIKAKILTRRKIFALKLFEESCLDFSEMANFIMQMNEKHIEQKMP